MGMRTKIMSGFIADIWSGFTVPNAPCKIKIKLQFKFTKVDTVSNEYILFTLVKLQKKNHESRLQYTGTCCIWNYNLLQKQINTLYSGIFLNSGEPV